ncbi:MAG: hypothetical protein AABZ44_04115 [Elusimicrobiota bacterium]
MRTRIFLSALLTFALSAAATFAGNAEDLAARAGARFGEGNTRQGAALALAFNDRRKAPTSNMIGAASLAPGMIFNNHPSLAEATDYSNPGAIVTGGGNTGSGDAGANVGMIVFGILGAFMGAMIGASAFGALGAVTLGVVGLMVGLLIGAFIGLAVWKLNSRSYYV